MIFEILFLFKQVVFGLFFWMYMLSSFLVWGIGMDWFLRTLGVFLSFCGLSQQAF